VLDIFLDHETITILDCYEPNFKQLLETVLETRLIRDTNWDLGFSRYRRMEKYSLRDMAKGPAAGWNLCTPAYRSDIVCAGV